MILKNGIYQSELIPVRHGFTTRAWGNLGYGKNPRNPEVTSNRGNLFTTFGLQNFVHIQPKQIHSAITIDANRFIPGQEGDASYTNSSKHLLSVLTADCIPILLYHPDGIVAVIHAGWRGLIRRVIPETLRQLPKNPVAALGSAIGTCCYEVSEDLAKDFVAKFGEGVVDRNYPKPHLDLVRTAIHQLKEAGVENLETMNLCTSCHTDLFFSFRRDGSSGRQMAFIAL